MIKLKSYQILNCEIIFKVQEAVDRINRNPNLRVMKNNNPEEIFVPPRGAIAHHLVQSWLDKK